MTRTIPRNIKGNVFLMVLKILGAGEDDKYTGSLRIGIADTTPCENTKEPTPRSICIIDKNSTLSLLEQCVKTYQGHTERLALG